MTPEELLNASEAVGARQGTDKVTSLMLVFLDVLERLAVPPALVEPRAVAVRYWREGAATQAELLEARHATWQFIDAPVQRADSLGNAAILARATLCVLDPTVKDEEWFETVEWFSEWTSRFGGSGLND